LGGGVLLEVEVEAGGGAVRKELNKKVRWREKR